MLGKIKHMDFGIDLSKFDSDDYQYVKLAYGGEGNKKVMFILDYMPSEDLHKGRMLSGATGDLLNNVLQTSLKKFGQKNSKFQWLACSYNAFRTVGKSHEFVDQAHEAFSKRIRTLIGKYKPDIVVGFGRQVFNSLAGREKELTNNAFVPWLGRALNKKIKLKNGEEHNYKFVPTLSLNNCLNTGGSGASLLGLVCKNLGYLFGTEDLVDIKRLAKRKSIFVDTLDKFKAMMLRLEEQEEPVAVDTETKNLAKVTNKLLTIQFAPDMDTGYFLPIYHKESPFTPKEMEYIQKRLKRYFEGKNSNKYHIYANATFDLTVIAEDLKVEFFENDIWDIFAGEFALDENLKGTMSNKAGVGEWYYSLLNQSVQHGIEEYLTAEFKKEDRANFANVKLDKGTVQYGTLDVCGPYAIHEIQKKRGQRLGYKKYEKVVRYEISDTIHSFAQMEHKGNLLDTAYLFYLSSDQSPIKTLIKDLERTFTTSPAAKKANARLLKKQGIPQNDMWGSSSDSSVLKINKPEHLQMVFYDVLKLKPLATGASGKGKLDKEFQSAYKDVAEVGLYTKIQKAKKIRDAFVNSFMDKLRKNPDVQKDKKIRSKYSYLKVVTHRTSSSDPNLQQIPTHSELAKFIKRLFITPEGFLYIKVDYQVHEVRGWGMISGDKEVAKTFAHGKALRDQFKSKPSPELAKRIELEGDVHRINAAYFFKLAIEEIDKKIRNSVKAVVFGLIYGKGIRALAEDINGTVEQAEELLEKFFKRFPKAVGWTRNIKLFAKKHLYTEALNGIRRNLWGYLIPDSHEDKGKIHSQMDRQAGNSPIQGMCSKFMMNGIRLIHRYSFKLRKQRGEFSLETNNSVHDSLESIAKYKDLMKSIALIEWCLTDGVKDLVESRHKTELISTPQIDMDFGENLSQCITWDTSYAMLVCIIYGALTNQAKRLRKSEDFVRDSMNEVFKQYDDYPTWLKSQVYNIRNDKIDKVQREAWAKTLKEGFDLPEESAEQVEFYFKRFVKSTNNHNGKVREKIAA